MVEGTVLFMKADNQPAADSFVPWFTLALFFVVVALFALVGPERVAEIVFPGR